MSEPSDSYKKATFDLLVALRGGLPDTCDFCHKPYGAERYPVPEEAGEWACTECVARWQKQDADAQREKGG